jgi:hypothetical protein
MIRVSTPNIVPNGKNTHSIQATMKLNQYLFLFAKDRPEAIKSIECVSPINKARSVGIKIISEVLFCSEVVWKK